MLRGGWDGKKDLVYGVWLRPQGNVASAKINIRMTLKARRENLSRFTGAGAFKPILPVRVNLLVTGKL